MQTLEARKENLAPSLVAEIFECGQIFKVDVQLYTDVCVI